MILEILQSNEIDLQMARAIGAALALGLGALGTGIAQALIGGSAAGMLAERPDEMGSAIILIAIPETILVLSFVIAIMILLGIGG
ncbi:MAG: ATPase [Candidatus Hodarchaeales archaeon]|jgi:V/A-type H+-transporting ATPase subunit K